MDRYSQLDTVIEEIMSRWDIPGMGIGIVQEGEIVYARGFGVQSLATGVPVNVDSIFGVASISKCFIASAVMQLVEQGKVRLDLPLVEYLPDFQMNDERYQEIAIRQMLSHTSGIPDMDEAEYDQLIYHSEYDEAVLARYVHALASCKMIAAPGNRFAYSNIGYNVLSYLIARISGKSFEEYMKKQILLPAAMPDSTFFFPEVSPDRLAVPHLRTPTMIVNPVYPYHRADAAASFLHSTVIDMCHWAITCLDGGILNGQHVLSQASYDLMWLPVVERGYTPLYENNGLGWVLGHFDGLRTVIHGGGGFGWTDLLVMLTNCPVHARDCLNSPQERSRDMRSLCLISARVTASSTNRWTNGSFLPCNGLSNNCHK